MFLCIQKHKRKVFVQFYQQVYDALFEAHDLSKEGYLKRELDGETFVANTMVSTLKEAREQLYIPFKNSWAFAKINL